MADKVLSAEHRSKLDDVVHQMESNGEPSEAIQTVVDDFKQKYAAVETPAQKVDASEPDTWLGGAWKQLKKELTPVGPSEVLQNVNESLEPLAHPKTVADFGNLLIPNMGGMSAGRALTLGRQTVSDLTPGRAAIGRAVSLGGDILDNPVAGAISPRAPHMGKIVSAIGERLQQPAAAQLPAELERFMPNTGGKPAMASPPLPDPLSGRVPYAESSVPAITRESQLRGLVSPATPAPSVEEALLRQGPMQATDQPIAALSEIANPGARRFMDEEFVKNNPIAQQALGQSRVGGPMPTSPNPVDAANAAHVAELQTAPKAYMDRSAQISGRALERRMKAGTAPEGMADRRAIQPTPEPVAVGGNDAPVEAATPRATKVALEDAGVPKSKSRSSAPSATPGWTVADVESIGMNPKQKILSLTQDMIDRMMENRSRRHGVHHATAQMSSFNRNLGREDPITEELLLQGVK